MLLLTCCTMFYIPQQPKWSGLLASLHRHSLFESTADHGEEANLPMCRGIGFYFAADFSVAALVELPKPMSPEERMHLVTVMNETTLDGYSILHN